ncbi:Imm1 family immunity protein [Streptomyces sp. NPDC026673]|uniref:Imm1 family immunity protein n=1 Tax=Streptomyces sp. NPDC026673 TaxID=3155724 RepID=UPI0033EB74E5
MTIRGLEVQFRPEHIKTPALLASANDVDSFIDALLNGRHDRSCAVVYSLDRPTLPSGYWDHELAVGVDRVAQVGALTLADDGNFVSKGSIDRGIVEYMLLGHVREFMAGSEIPIELVRRAVKEFLGSGGRIPACIEWQEEEF